MVRKAFSDSSHLIGVYSDEQNATNDERMSANQWHCVVMTEDQT